MTIATNDIEPTPDTATAATGAPERYLTDDARWQALLDRDAAADGQFFVCVHTTGIYCRPTCPARRPKRENVSFVKTRAEALRAGFRPCKRCRPDEAADLPARQAEMIARICAEIAASPERLTLDQLAEKAGMSRFHFHRLFKQVTGVTPKVYESARRAERVRERLGSAATVTEAIYDSGFASNGRFYATSGNVLGMTPTVYRAGGEGMTIRVAAGVSTLGVVLVAASDRGLCSVTMGEDFAELRDDLRRRFPRATIVDADPSFAGTVERVIAQIEEPSRPFELPLDIRGTAFQQRVWQALREVPAGGTASYSEIATRIGAPKAVRAVAQACKTNKIAVVIPCHRVVGKDGSLTGYNWGTERKRELLEREHAAIAGAGE